jgi:integrase
MTKDSIVEIPIFEKWLENKGISQSTIYQYSMAVKKFLLTEPRIDNIEDYNNFLFEYSIKKRSFCYYHALKSYIKFKLSGDRSKMNNMLRAMITPKMQDPIKTTRYLDAETKKQIINLLKDSKHRVIAKIQNVTGVRIGDVLRLKRGSISYEVYSGKQIVMRIDFIGKGNKRFVKWIFDEDVMNSIDLFIKSTLMDSEYYFLERDRSFNDSNLHVMMRTNYHRYWEDLKQALEVVGVSYKDWASHDFRRSLAREVWDETKDPMLLKEALNHAQFETTARYLRTSGLRSQDLYNLLANKNKKK